MFSNGVGYQIHGGNFYEVSGDVNLRSITLQSHDFYRPSTLGFEDNPVGTSERLGPVRDLESHDATFQPVPSLPLEARQAQGSEHELRGGVARHPRHGKEGRKLPYDATSRPRSQPPSSNSTGLTLSSGGLSGPITAPGINSPPSSTSSSIFYPSSRYTIPDLRPQYPGTYPHSNSTTLVDSLKAHRYMAYSPPLVQGGTFITAENVNHRQGETGINILHRAVALEALYDSADSFPQPRCHPETRTKMLDGLYNWAVGNDCTRPICWLRGPAGAGKSAVMQTLCHKLQDADRMDGAFFFKRGHSTCGNAKVLFTTLAYQLALNHRNLKLSISQSVENDPSVVGRQMDVQLPKLILEPCQSLINCRPLTLLIDGLDECQNQCSQREILRLIATAVRRYPNLFRFLIASRPEPHIREIIEDLSCEGILDSINVEQSFDDVRRYFRDEFARIHSDHWDCMGSVPTPWPSPEILDILVHESSGYFVYASTIIKFVDDRYFRPTERLAAVQNPIPILINSDSPFDALDQLYIQILSGVPTQFHSTLCDILQCAIMFDFKLKPIQLDRLLDLRPGDVQLICRGLHSILEMDSTSGISVHHASFVDFLQDPRRSSIFHPNLENRMNVTRAVVKTLSHDIRWLDNIHDPLAWCLAGDDFFKCITSIASSAEFLPLIRLVNPDFLWWDRLDMHFQDKIQDILNWLKAIQPIPEDLIQRWKAYQFMFFWETLHHQVTMFLGFEVRRDLNQVFLLSPQMLRALQTKMDRLSPVSVADCRRFLTQSPEFIRIFQARGLLNSCLFRSPYRLSHLYHLRLLLNLSWDDITAAFSALSSFIGTGTLKQVVAGIITVLALSFELYPANTSSLISDLASGFLHFIQRIGAGKLPLSVWSHFSPYGNDYPLWGRLIRCSPPSKQLLRELDEFVPPWNLFPSSDHARYCLCPSEFHDVVQWLKVLSDPPLELIERWKGYLSKSRDICLRLKLKTCTDEELERNWQKDLCTSTNTAWPFDEDVLF